MRKFVLKLFDSHNTEVEMHLVLVCLGVVVLIGLSIYHVVVLCRNFEAANYGEGLGYLLAGGGAAAWGQGLQRAKERGRADDPDQ